MTDVIYRN